MIKPGTYTIVPVVRGEHTVWRIKRGWFTLTDEHQCPTLRSYGDPEPVEVANPAAAIDLLVRCIWAAGRRLHRKTRARQRAAAARAVKPRPVRWP